MLKEIAALHRRLAELEKAASESPHVVRRHQAHRRLRETVWRMQRAEDIASVVEVMGEGIKGLGIVFQDCNVNLVDRQSDPPSVLSCRLKELGWQPAGTGHGADLVLQIWREGRVVYRQDLHAEDRYGEREHIERLFGACVRSVVDVPFSHGTVAVNSAAPHAFSPQQIADLQYLAEVLEEGFRRLDDLRIVEQRCRELEVQERQHASRERLREALWQLRRSADIPPLLGTLYRELKELFPQIACCSVQLLQSENRQWKAYSSKGTALEEWEGWESPGEAVTVCWRKQRPVYRPDLTQEDLYGEAERVWGNYSPEIRSVLDVPFPQGTLAVNSRLPQAFAEAEIAALAELAHVLSAGLAQLSELQSQARYRTLVETPSDMVVMYLTQDHHYVYVSPQVEAMTGYRPEEFYADPELGEKIAPREDGKRGEQTFLQVIDSGVEERLEIRWRRRDEQGACRRWALETFSPVRDAAGQLEAVQIIFQDITLRKQAEQELRNEHEQLLSLLGSIDQPIYVADMDDYEILFANRALEKAFGKPLVGGCCYRELQGKEHPCEFCTNAIIKTLDYRPQVWDFHNPRLNRDFQLIDRVIRWSDGREVRLEIAFDITERKQLEQEWVRTQRLRAIGELSVGVSHNLNNLLVGVLGPAQLLEQLLDKPEQRELVETILLAGRRARDLVHRLHLSVRSEPESALQALSLDAAIQEVVQATRPRWQDEAQAHGLSIEVICRLASTPPIKGTASGLRDLLATLLNNAIEAMPQGGEIILQTCLEGTFVRLDCRDTGIGMDEPTRLRLFEPFFTTKANVGSGLGLSTLLQTLTHWGGRVTVDSAPGQGTTFALWFPTWPAEIPKNILPTTSRTGQILLVEDEEVVVKVLRQALASKHRQVKAFTDGRQALAHFCPGHYAVAIIDLGMPGISGEEVARQLEAQDPAVVRVLFTGWELAADDPRRRHFDLELRKPLNTLEDLDALIEKALEIHEHRRGPQP